MIGEKNNREATTFTFSKKLFDSSIHIIKVRGILSDGSRSQNKQLVKLKKNEKKTREVSFKFLN